MHTDLKVRQGCRGKGAEASNACIDSGYDHNLADMYNPHRRQMNTVYLSRCLYTVTNLKIAADTVL